MPPTRQYVGEFVKVRVPLAGAYSNPWVQERVATLHELVAESSGDKQVRK